jgi:hypothetical protein
MGFISVFPDKVSIYRPRIHPSSKLFALSHSVEQS